MNDTESKYDIESESEEENKVSNIANKKIEQIFCPKTEKELECLFSIMKNFKLIKFNLYFIFTLYL
jgi:hypothetical protein